MDKKAKKRIVILRQRKEKLRKQLKVVRQFPDDPGEPGRLEAEIAAIDTELVKLTEG